MAALSKLRWERFCKKLLADGNFIQAYLRVGDPGAGLTQDLIVDRLLDRAMAKGSWCTARHVLAVLGKHIGRGPPRRGRGVMRAIAGKTIFTGIPTHSGKGGGGAWGGDDLIAATRILSSRGAAEGSLLVALRIPRDALGMTRVLADDKDALRARPLVPRALPVVPPASPVVTFRPRIKDLAVREMSSSDPGRRT
jgi:hypothetical protein